MKLFNPSITMSQNGDRWTLVVEVTETFLSSELAQHFEFEHWVTLWEWDESDHDFLGNLKAVRFRPSVEQKNVQWIWPTLSGEHLDTELGGEEVRVQIFLRNATIGGEPFSVFTPIQQISPG